MKNLHRIIDGIELKYCTACKRWFDLSLFYRHKISHDGLSYICKKCDSIRVKKYNAKNKIKTATYSKEWHSKDKARKTQHSKKWRKSNPDKVAAYREANREKGKGYRKKYRRKKRLSLKGNLSERMTRNLWRSLRSNKAGNHWEDLVGYTCEQLKKRLQKTMPNGYGWQDYLDGKLHIDHIVPVSVFNYKTSEDIDFEKCWALKNLQLLPADENRRKSNKLKKPFQPSFSGF